MLMLRELDSKSKTEFTCVRDYITLYKIDLIRSILTRLNSKVRLLTVHLSGAKNNNLRKLIKNMLTM